MILRFMDVSTCYLSGSGVGQGKFGALGILIVEGSSAPSSL